MKSDPSVAFAHTISADFTDPKHMSAGVAVLFGKVFGKPQFSDYISQNLTRQGNFNNEATVYSLVTKAKYYNKPTESDYRRAFKQLALNFKSSGLKTLVCPPMGCVRDLIQPDFFVQNLVDFQCQTNATIIIVSYHPDSTRIMKNGLSHTEFLSLLQNSISRRTTTHHQEVSLSPLCHFPPEQQPPAYPCQNLQSSSPVGPHRTQQSSIPVCLPSYSEQASLSASHFYSQQPSSSTDTPHLFQSSTSVYPPSQQNSMLAVCPSQCSVAGESVVSENYDESSRVFLDYCK